MKERETYPGKTYAVRSADGCTITDINGDLIKECAAGQDYFVADVSRIFVSDDNAKVQQVFNLAPQQRLTILGVLGGGVPVWLTQLNTELTAMLDGSAFETAWLAGKKQLIVHTDRVDDDMLAAVLSTAYAAVPAGVEVVQYNHILEISWRDINKYAACTTAAEMKAVNPDYKNDLTSSGAWVYPIPSMVSGSSLFSGAENMKSFEADISHLTNINSMFYCSGLDSEVVIRNALVTVATGVLAGSNNYGFYTHVTLDLPNVTDITHICYHSSATLQVVKGNLDKVQIADAAFFGRYATDYYSILDFQIPLPSLSDGRQMFNRMGLTKASVLLICDSIPPYEDGSTHDILLGIHRDLQADEEVLAAIERANGKGWTVSVQWNGHWVSLPKAATTYSLRRPAAPPVYAMLKRDANGEFVDATNTRYMVDWFHELHRADGVEPEELGYTLFESLEAALTEWGLTEYMEIPEEPKDEFLTPTEQ